MFVHWGLYAIHGLHEQEQWRYRVPRAEYQKLAQQWNPVKYDPNAWLDLAAAAGMKYICLTTKHHDGFCLFDTKQTSYNTMNTPYGKDIVKMLADACHKRGVPLCLYYSIADWHQPNYPNQGRSHELPPQPGDQPDLRQVHRVPEGAGARAVHELRRTRRLLVGHERGQEGGPFDQRHDPQTAAQRGHQ